MSVTVPGSLTFDDSRAILEALTGGAGLMYAPEPWVAPLLATGSVRLVLEESCALGSGFHAYYSSRRQLPTRLRLLIDLVRELKPLGF